MRWDGTGVTTRRYRRDFCCRDARHFTQVFRRRYQLTPTEYRHQQQVNIIS
ncbi:AraC family transcriptional regulator [Paenibacillus antibioticophila]|uniref:AraC family transcriptional regulator n=1 Tax=Paenibacillus antibioticophila TaxID=1274374 RepID=UPI003709749E